MIKKIFDTFDIFLDFLLKYLRLKSFFNFLKKYKKFLFSCVLFVLFVFAFWLSTWTSEELLYYKQKLIELSQERAFLSGFIFFIVYFIVCLIGAPGSVFLSSVSAFVFGFFKSFVISLFAVILGSGCAFLITRYFLRDFFMQQMQKKRGAKLSKFYNRLKKNEVYYLFIFRLFPFTPLAITNIVMGLGTMKLRVFLSVCFISILPYLLIYISVGAKLSQLESWEQLSDPMLILVFSLMALFPVIVKFALKIVKKHTSSFQSDLEDYEQILKEQ